MMKRRSSGFSKRGGAGIPRASFRLPIFMERVLYRFNIPSFLTGGIPSFDTVRSSIAGFSPMRHWRPLALIAGGIALFFVIMLVMDFSRVRALATFNADTTTKIYDRNGVLVSELFREKREVVPYEKIPQNMVKAFIAMEDNDFYSHFGVNPKGIVRAFFINIASGRVRQGGSTITQQLAKILMTDQKRTLYRKAKEFFIAVMIEAFYSKERIMELYLNQLFLGHGTYGVESASMLYFGKHVWQLNLAECALIATLPSAPNLLSPIKYPEKSMMMHRIALSKMADMGYITIEQAEQAYMDFWPDYIAYINEMPPSMSAWSVRVDNAPWFTEYIRRKLVAEYGEEMVYQKGLSVYTTLDLRMQAAAQKVMSGALAAQNAVSSRLAFRREDAITEDFGAEVELIGLLMDMNPISKKGSLQTKRINDAFQSDALDELEIINLLAGNDIIGDMCADYKYNYFQDREFMKVEGALISLDHSNGYITAMVGGSSFEMMNQLNRSVQSYRQSGSSIKPLLYAEAMESGKFTPATVMLDSPALYLDMEGGDWIPENYEGGYRGMIRLRQALALSINVVSVKIAETIGIERVMNAFGRFFGLSDSEMKRRIPRNFSIALGSAEVTPLEMARAYGVIANGGVDIIPFSIRHIKTRDGAMLRNYEEEIRKKDRRRVIKPETSQIMISMLESVINGGTGAGANPGRPAGGKTGTTSGWRDAWFVGFSPEIATALWMGYDSQGFSLGEGQTGGGIAAPAWGRYMREALSGLPVQGFPSYAGLASAEVCALSGLLPSTHCTEKINEVFIPGTVPTEVCKQCEERSADGYKLNIEGPKESLVEKNREEIGREIRTMPGKKPLDGVGDELLR